MTRFVQLRERYGAKALLVLAVLAAIVAPPETRNAVWHWLLKGLNAMDVIVIVGAFRMMSNVEHRKTYTKINGIGDKLDNGFQHSIDRIEKQLNAFEEVLKEWKEHPTEKESL